MSEQVNSQGAGSLKISQEVIASIAGYTATDTEGVTSLATVGLTERLSKKPVRPVSIQLSDGVAVIDIRLRVKHGARIPELSRKLQASVKEAVQNMTGVVVSKVNLQIAGVDFSDENREDREK